MTRSVGLPALPGIFPTNRVSDEPCSIRVFNIILGIGVKQKNPHQAVLRLRFLWVLLGTLSIDDAWDDDDEQNCCRTGSKTSFTA